MFIYPFFLITVMLSWIIITLFILSVVAAIIVFNSFKLQDKNFKKTGKYPEGYYQNKGLAIGVGAGLPIGVAMDNIALGIAMGACIGIAIGASLEKKYANKLRPQTKEEKGLYKNKLLFLLVIGIIGLILSSTFFFLFR